MKAILCLSDIRKSTLKNIVKMYILHSIFLSSINLHLLTSMILVPATKLRSLQEYLIIEFRGQWIGWRRPVAWPSVILHTNSISDLRNLHLHTSKMLVPIIQTDLQVNKYEVSEIFKALQYLPYCSFSSHARI